MSYTPNVPQATQTFAQTQQPIADNFTSANTIFGQDHVNFTTTPPQGLPGQHLQVTFNSENTPLAPTDPISIMYTTAGTASTKADGRFRNENGIFQCFPIKAWAVFSSAGITNSQSFNVASVTNPSTGTFTVTMTANATTGTTFGVLVSCRGGSIVSNYLITGANTFNVFFVTLAGAPFNPTAATVAVIQV